MKTFIRILCFVGLLLLNTVIQAQQITQQISYSINDVEVQEMDGYDVIGIVDGNFLEDEENIGNPQLPIATLNVLVPKGSVITGVTVTIGQETQLPGSFNIFPAQPPSYPDFSDPPPFVAQKPSIYTSNDPFPENSLVDYEVQGFRDYTYVHINYIPFRYLPSVQELYLANSITVTINYSVNPPKNYKKRSYNHHDEMAYQQIKSIVSNAIDLDNFYPDVVTQLNNWRNTSIISGYEYETTDLPSPFGSRVEYVIITNDTDISGNFMGNFIQKFQEFADWKTQSGVPAKIVTVDAIRKAYPGADVQEQIRKFIQEAHALWGTEYVLLGGSAKIIPVRWIPGPQPTDTYYSAIYHPETGYDDNWNANGDHVYGQNSDGADFEADIAVGRAPVNTEAEIENFIHKNFTYARNSLATTVPDGVWLGRQLGSYGACFDRRIIDYGDPYNTKWSGTGLHVGYEIIQAHHTKINMYGMFEYVVDRNDPDPINFDSWCRAYYPLHNSTCTENFIPIDYADASHSGLLNQINQGYGMINILDHGGPYRIGLGKVTQLPGISMLDFQNLPDTGKYGVLLAGGCHTVPLEREDYIGERWVNSLGGGVSFFGASMNMSASQSYVFNKRFYNQLHEENIYKLGWLHAKAANTDYQRKIMQLLGDPELSVYTEIPTNLQVTHANTITNGNQNFEVNVSGFPVGNTVKVSLYKEGEVLAYTETDTFPVIFNITPDTVGELTITVTSRNKEPYETTIPVTQYSGTHLYKSGISFTDENNNGIIEPGEEVNVTFELSNTGASGATNISAVLGVTGTNTQVTQNTSAYSDIASGQTANNQISYTFTASTEENLRALPFELLISSAESDFIEEFLLPLKRSELEIGNRAVLVNGVETNVFHPSDIAELFIDVQNIGVISAESLTAELIANDLSSGVVTISHNTSPYGTIEPGEEKTNTEAFVINIGTNYNGEDLIFELALTDQFGLEKRFTIDLTEDDPPLISGFEYNASDEYINTIWRPVQNIKGFNIYRSEIETGVFERVNERIIPRVSMYTDLSVLPMSEYWYKISVVTLSGKELPIEALTPYFANTTLAKHGGFPIKADPSSAERAKFSPTVYDINGNGKKEIFLSYSNEFQQLTPYKGRIMGFYESGEELFDIDGNATEVWGFAETELIVGSMAVGDIDNDGQAEVFSIGRDNANNKGVLYGYRTVDTNNNNKPDLLWPISFNPGQINIGHRTTRAPVLADLNGDGYLEIIILDEKQRISIYDHNKNLLGQKQLGNTDYALGEIAVADVDGDGFKEIIIGCKSVNGKGAIYIWDHNGDFNKELDLIKEFGSGERADGGIVLADINNDGKYEILAVTKQNSTAKIYALNIDDGSFVNNNWSGALNFPVSNDQYEEHIMPRIAVGDLENDGELKIVFGSKDSLFVLDKNGEITPGFPVNIGNMWDNAPVLADIDGDEQIEIIINSDGVLKAFKPDGTECVGWNIEPDTDSYFVGTPFVGDIDDDGKNEIVISSNDVTTYVWKTAGNANRVEWGSYRENAQNTAVYKEDCTFSSLHNVTITGPNNLWDTPKHIQGNLEIKQNSTLTISSTVTFTPNSRIIVEPGAHLIIDGGKLSTNCGKLWKGIWVRGNSNLPQIPNNQGQISLTNNAVIEYAKIAIYSGNSMDGLWHLQDASGGIIKINGAVLRDNIVDVKIEDYIFANQSHIKNSLFESTEYLRDLGYFPQQNINLWKVGTILIQNNIFKNLQEINPYTNTHDLIEQGNGIVGVNARINIKNNVFENLYSGIKISNFTGLIDLATYVDIDDNLFENNWNGVYLNSTRNTRIISNNFNVFTTFLDGLGVNGSSGIYIVNSEGFHIENNSLKSSGLGGFTTGVFIRDSKVANEIYKNMFSNLYTGIYAMGQNTTSNPIVIDTSEGLELICNEFNNNSTDIYIAPASTIAKYQGSINLSAGNTFLPYCEEDIKQFNNQGLQINYLGENNSLYLPQCNYNVNLFSTASPNNCESTLGRPFSDSDILAMDMEIQQNTIQHLALTDGGNTEILSSLIDMSQTNEGLLLRNKLLEESPFLSDTIMVKSSAVEDVLPSLLLKEILVANPKAAKSDKVQTALDNRTDQMPAYMREEIDQGKDVLSTKESLESILSKNINQREQIVNRVINNKIRDSISNLSEIENLLLNESQQRISRSYELIEFYLSRGKVQEAQTILNLIPQNHFLNSSEQMEYNKFTSLYNIKKDLLESDKSWFEIDSTQLETLNLLAIDSTTNAGMQSRAILSLVKGIDYGLPIPMKVNTMQRQFPDPIEDTFNVFPKIADNYFIIENIIPFDVKQHNLKIEILNSKHEIMFEDSIRSTNEQFLIESLKWENGVYLCRRIKNGVIEKTSTVIIKRGSDNSFLNIDQEEFKVFPNPSEEHFFIASNVKRDVEVTITNNLGQVIKSFSLKEMLTGVSTLSWSSGIYFINFMIDESQKEVVKIIVK